MSKPAVSVSGWADLSEAQRIECVRAGEATLKEMVEGLLDGSETLRQVCKRFLLNTDVCLRQPTATVELKDETHDNNSDESTSGLLEGARKRRQGLPEGYVPRVHRHESRS